MKNKLLEQTEVFFIYAILSHYGIERGEKNEVELWYTLRHKKLLLFDFISVFMWIYLNWVRVTDDSWSDDEIGQGDWNNDFNFMYRGRWGHNDWWLQLSASSWVSHYATCSSDTSRMVAAIRDDLFGEGPNFFPFRIWTNCVPSLITRATNDAYQIMLFMQNIWPCGLWLLWCSGQSLYLNMRNESWKLRRYVLLSLPILIISGYFDCKNIQSHYQRSNKRT